MKNYTTLFAALLGCSTLTSFAVNTATSSNAEAKEINALVDETSVAKLLEKFSASVGVGYESSYIFRGYEICNGIVSPTVNLGYDVGAGFAVYGGYWGGLSVMDKSSYDNVTGETISGHFVENDFSAGITYTIENFTIDVGYLAYTYDVGGNTNEAKVGVSYDTAKLLGDDFAVSPYVVGYYDFSLSAKTLESGLSYSAPITKWLIGSNWGTLDFGGYAGYYYAPETHSFYTGISAGGTIAFTENCSLSAGMRYQYFNNESEGCGGRVWFGTSMSIGF